MNPIESLRISWRAIRGHKLRSTLTTLGVIIGIAAVITFVTLGAGLQDEIIGDISPDDQQNVYVWAAPPENSGQGPLAGAQPVFTQRDANNIANLSGVDDAYVYTQVPGQSVTYAGQTVPRDSGFIATGPGYFDDDIAEGVRFESGTNEAVVNPAMAGLFEENVTVGDTLTLGIFRGTRVNVTVVGILENSESMSAFEGFSPAPRLYVPADFQGVGAVDEDPRYIAMVAEAPSKSAPDIDRTKAVTEEYLNSSDSDASDRAEGLGFQLKTSTELISQLEDVLNLLQDFVVGIAGISLLVGSIGIANIMLVSVTERTREIGIMKAVGAQRRDILGLFIIEAVILGVLGAVLGTLLGVAAGYVVAGYIGIPWVFPTTWSAIAIVVGIVVGVLAGLYPAWNASRTDPIDALRYE
ncbi:MAG: ABC transporter permease [Halapricum sp.]